jgi:hypothetical protein
MSCVILSGTIMYAYIGHRASVTRFVLLQSPNSKTVGRTPWTGNQPAVRAQPTHRTTQTQNKRRQTSTLSVGFKPMISVFERAKTVHALDRAATVIAMLIHYFENMSEKKLVSTKSILPNKSIQKYDYDNSIQFFIYLRSY